MEIGFEVMLGSYAFVRKTIAKNLACLACLNSAHLAKVVQIRGPEDYLGSVSGWYGGVFGV